MKSSFDFLLPLRMDAALFGRLSRISREQGTSFAGLVVNLLREACDLEPLPRQPRGKLTVTAQGIIRERPQPVTVTG